MAQNSIVTLAIRFSQSRNYTSTRLRFPSTLCLDTPLLREPTLLNTYLLTSSGRDRNTVMPKTRLTLKK